MSSGEKDEQGEENINERGKTNDKKELKLVKRVNKCRMGKKPDGLCARIKFWHTVLQYGKK
jgi:hypothetical protein